MTTEYSRTPLIKKLGIKDGMKVLLLHEPENYFEILGTNVSLQFCKKNERPDIIHLFVKTKKEYETGMKEILTRRKPTTIIWVSWYKKTAKITTDVTEDVIRNYALQNGLVDVKVCA